MFNIPGFQYPLIFQSTTFALCLIMYLQYVASPNNDKLLEQRSALPAIFLSTVLILFIGLRPVHPIFGDTMNYAQGYYATPKYFAQIDWSSEWLFKYYTYICRNFNLSVNQYFLGIEIGYIGFQMLSCRRLIWESPWLALMFLISAFSFFTYSVNGMRNGVACAMTMYAIVLVATNGSRVLAAVIVFLAMGIHRSVVLPASACVAAMTVVRNPKWAIYLWFASIGISLVGGASLMSMFSGLGFDERTDRYLSGQYFEENNFSRAGFRWDFLIYSSMPVLLTYYAVVKRGIEDRAFNIIATTYILSNAFWVMVNRAAFSNRFAYLSWFLYALVLAYGFIRLHLWDNQDSKCAWALLAHSSFTLVMFMLGKA